MSEQNNGLVDTLVDKRIASDTDFQTSIASLKDEEKNPLIESKRKEILEQIVTEGEKAAELAGNYKTRAEKAEGDLKKYKPTDNKGNDDGLSTKDVYALMNSKVPEEDIDEVKEYAKLKGISVADALKSNVVKAILSDKQETRKTANATQTRSTRTSTRPDAATVMAEVKTKGESGIPEKGSEAAEELFWARHGGRRGK